MTNSAEYWIERLKLEPHPEGGFFRQTYRSEISIARECLPLGFAGSRAASTAIYFLLQGLDFSAFHRLKSDEVWHFYAGSPVSVHMINAGGTYSELRLGMDMDAGEAPQHVVPAGCWFASHVTNWKSTALVGCTVAPGFDFHDFEMGTRAELIAAYSQHRNLIERLTRE
jgi:uncharacterized protein